MTLGRRSASQAWNAVANFTQGEVQARWWNSRQPRRQRPLMSRWEGQPVKADDLARWVAAFQVDSEGVRYMQSGPPPALTAVGRSRRLRIDGWISARVGGDQTGPTRAPNLPPTRRPRRQSLGTNPEQL